MFVLKLRDYKFKMNKKLIFYVRIKAEIKL